MEAVDIQRVRSTTTPGAGGVRAFKQADLPEVAALLTRLFPNATIGPEVRQERLRQICFENPWDDERLPSLVYEEPGGRITGFLGVMPRRMWFGNRTVVAAVCHYFMVEAETRSSLAAVALLRQFLAGPQDLSLSEAATEIVARLWERLGGFISAAQSIHWRRPLRPTEFVLSVLRGRGVPSWIAPVVTPVSRVIDAGIARLPGSPFTHAQLRVAEEPLTTEILLECLNQHAAHRLLRPVYDARSLTWLLDLAGGPSTRGSLQRVAVRSESGELVGWYLYYLKRGGQSRVLQVGATGRAAGDVLDSLFAHAWRHGAVELSGRLDPNMLRAFSGRFCFLIPDFGRMLVYSHHADVLHAIDRGDALLSSLEGDPQLLT